MTQGESETRPRRNDGHVDEGNTMLKMAMASLLVLLARAATPLAAQVRIRTPRASRTLSIPWMKFPKNIVPALSGGLSVHQLWHRLLGRPASESGAFCHGDGRQGRGDRRPEGAIVAFALNVACAPRSRLSNRGTSVQDAEDRLMEDRRWASLRDAWRWSPAADVE
jgi:hypothetical protein